MARETKVGLIAGLAFIICFAVILSNQGRTLPSPFYQPAGQTPVVVSSDSDGRPLTQRTGPFDATRSALESPRGSRQGESSLRRERAVPARLDRGPTGGADVVFLTPEERTPDPASWTAGESVKSEADGRDRASSGQRSLSGRGERGSRRQLEARLDALSARVNSMETGAGVGGATGGDGAHEPVRTSARAEARGSLVRADKFRRYRVVSGDTLSKIAATYYGSASRRVIDAIFDTNRSLLSSPDKVPLGVELVLPSLQAGGGGAAPRESNKPDSASGSSGVSNASDAGQTFRWYQVKQGDRYISIAREQLGDQRRWHEIFEFNKDRFPDPQRIRTGVRIKIPGGRVSSGAGSGR